MSLSWREFEGNYQLPIENYQVDLGLGNVVPLYKWSIRLSGDCFSARGVSLNWRACDWCDFIVEKHPQIPQLRTVSKDVSIRLLDH